MGLGIPPLEIKIMLASNPLKSIMLVRRLAVRRRVYVYGTVQCSRVKTSNRARTERAINKEDTKRPQTCVYMYMYVYIYIYIYTHCITCIHDSGGAQDTGQEARGGEGRGGGDPGAAARRGGAKVINVDRL